jgi:hypothetical protein
MRQHFCSLSAQEIDGIFAPKVEYAISLRDELAAKNKVDPSTIIVELIRKEGAWK